MDMGFNVLIQPKLKIPKIVTGCCVTFVPELFEMWFFVSEWVFIILQ
jgi:hypothetical protein